MLSDWFWQYDGMNQTDYLVRYEGVKAVVHQVDQFDESSALSTIYLGKVNMIKEDNLKAQKEFLLTDNSTTLGKLLNYTDCKNNFR